MNSHRKLPTQLAAVCAYLMELFERWRWVRVTRGPLMWMQHCCLSELRTAMIMSKWNEVMITRGWFTSLVLTTRLCRFHSTLFTCERGKVLITMHQVRVPCAVRHVWVYHTLNKIFQTLDIFKDMCNVHLWIMRDLSVYCVHFKRLWKGKVRRWCHIMWRPFFALNHRFWHF